jgi:protein-L-isoaspartate(D-aspartate) O-methyltransferase
MPDYATARLNMVENQIRPNRVSDERVLAAIAAVPRERFVPKRLHGNAYVDQDLALGNGRYLMEPVVFARLLQVAEIGAGDVVLDIGCGTGYSAAVLGKLAGTVVALESDAALAKQAIEALTELDVDNAAVVEGPLDGGYPRQAPYDVIVLGGAVDAVPAVLTDQLVEGGRLVAVVNVAPSVGNIEVIHRLYGGLSRRQIFDAAVPILPGFAAEHGFVF